MSYSALGTIRLVFAVFSAVVVGVGAFGETYTISVNGDQPVKVSVQGQTSGAVMPVTVTVINPDSTRVVYQTPVSAPVQTVSPKAIIIPVREETPKPVQVINRDPVGKPVVQEIVATQQEELPQRVSCAQESSDCERTGRERAPRDELGREETAREAAERKAACDRIMFEFQLQQQRQQQQFNQMLMQQMMNQQPINFAPMPTFTPTPHVSHTRTCTIHNCEYNPAFGGCPMCKAPDFGNGRKVCCPKCGMSHNSQYNCPRCGAW